MKQKIIKFCDAIFLGIVMNEGRTLSFGMWAALILIGLAAGVMYVGYETVSYIIIGLIILLVFVLPMFLGIYDSYSGVKKRHPEIFGNFEQ